MNARFAIPDKATHLVRGFAARVLLAEVWVQGWGTVQTETEVFKTLPHCDQIDVQWLKPDGPRRVGHIETVWRR